VAASPLIVENLRKVPGKKVKLPNEPDNGCDTQDCARSKETEKKLMKPPSIPASVGIVLFLAIASFAQQVKTDYDGNANFSQYKTYSWEKVHTQGQLWVDRIKEAVNTALAAKGWASVQSGGDVAIVAIETTQNQQTLGTFYNGFGGGWGWRRGGGFGGFGDATTEYHEYVFKLNSIGASRTESLIIVKPKTIVARHRSGFRLFSRWRSISRNPGRPKISGETHREVVAD
jgi:hypothetical protein